MVEKKDTQVRISKLYRDRLKRLADADKRSLVKMLEILIERAENEPK